MFISFFLAYAAHAQSETSYAAPMAMATTAAIVKVETYTSSLFAGTPDNFSLMDGPSTKALFNRPIGLALGIKLLTVDNQANVYVADFGNNAIRKIDKNGTVMYIN
jgi:DNA-binding beta-propeller fold protein YncE